MMVVAVFLLVSVLSVGVAALFFWFCVEMWSEFGTLAHVGMVLVFGPPVALSLLVPVVLYLEVTSPDLATLKIADWHCTASHDERRMIYVGKVLVPRTVTICDRYERLP